MAATSGVTPGDLSGVGTFDLTSPSPWCPQGTGKEKSQELMTKPSPVCGPLSQDPAPQSSLPASQNPSPLGLHSCSLGVQGPPGKQGPQQAVETRVVSKRIWSSVR